MVLIAPSILSADFARLQEDITDVERSGADLFHIDIMDGQFVPNISFGAHIVERMQKFVSVPLDVHLMIHNPENYIEQFVNSGADHITVHVEACVHLHRTIQLIKSYNLKAGIALNPATPLNVLEFIGDELDLLVIMTVNPGFGGQTIIPSVLPKIEEAKKLIVSNNWDIEIIVDGGVNKDSVAEVKGRGADIIVAGQGVFGARNRRQAINELRELTL